MTGRVVLVTAARGAAAGVDRGVRLGGAVTLEGLLVAVYDGLRLATILACLGAANALASPRRLLRYVPATLYEMGTAVVVALTFAPQLVEDAGRVRAARRLRGHSARGLRAIARLAVPVMVGALDRSLDLAASMESRGYGRAVHRTTGPARRRRRDHAGRAAGVVVGLYGLLDASTPLLLGLPLLLAGAVLAGRPWSSAPGATTRSRYRRDRWALPEWLVVVAGAAARGWCWSSPTQQAWPGVIPVQVPAAMPAVPLPLLDRARRPRSAPCPRPAAAGRPCWPAQREGLA